MFFTRKRMSDTCAVKNISKLHITPAEVELKLEAVAVGLGTLRNPLQLFLHQTIDDRWKVAV